jgi:hypothetical protein
MTQERQVEQAIRAAILASAHVTALEQVMAAQRACERLGTLGGGRWRAAARELTRLQAELNRGLPQVSSDVSRHAANLGIPEHALWTAGGAAGEYDDLHEQMHDFLDEDSAAARLLDAELVFGGTIVDDPDTANRGTTLLFAWRTPLAPAAWPWEANWIVSDDEEASDGERNGSDDGEDEEDDEVDEELELFAAGELTVNEEMLQALSSGLGVSQEAASEALQQLAMAFTRASLLVDEDDDENEEDDDSTG